MSLTATELLTAEQVESFHRDGLLVIPGFYDLETEIQPIQQAIHHIIGLLLRKYELDVEQLPFSPDDFDSGYGALIEHDRSIGGVVYDAVKQIPAFIRLLAIPRHETLVRQLRDDAGPGIAAGGYGIRIDNPREEKFRAPWHQDYLSQLRSPDGIVLWSALVPITEELGPVEFCLGSHRDGLMPVQTHDPRNPDKTGAYAQILKDEDEVVARYEHVAPLTKPGDLVLLDFLVLHQSGWNRGTRSRWSLQLRYFNFNSPEGIRIGWCGSFAAGVKVEDVLPDAVVH